jgi:hypothetical protein
MRIISDQVNPSPRISHRPAAATMYRHRRVTALNTRGSIKNMGKNR